MDEYKDNLETLCQIYENKLKQYGEYNWGKAEKAQEYWTRFYSFTEIHQKADVGDTECGKTVEHWQQKEYLPPPEYTDCAL
jgi:hypothetical protein